MARAYNIYVVMWGTSFVGAFTVKHECVTYLRSISQHDPLPNYYVVRTLDGCPSTAPVMFTAEEFLETNKGR